MKTKKVFLTLLTIYFCLYSINIVAQNAKIRKTRDVNILTYLNYDESLYSIPKEYLYYKSNQIILETPLNLTAQDYRNNSDLKVVSEFLYNYIMELYIEMMKNKHANSADSDLFESLYESMLSNSEIYYMGTISSSNVITANIFIISTKFEEPSNPVSIVCLTSNDKQVLSIAELSEYSSSGFGCYISKCELSNKLIFHKTWIMCGHGQDYRPLRLRKNARPFYKQKCISFRINPITGNIELLHRINS